MISNQDSFEAFDKLIAATPDKPAMSVVATGSAVATMSSLQIAEITGKPHGNVLQDIRRILDEAEIGQQEFLSSYRNAQNKAQPCYFLPRFECDLVVSGYSVKYRAAIIKRWHELEAKELPQQSFQIPTTMAEALRLAADLSEEKAVLVEKIEEDAPKVEFHDRVTQSTTVCSMATAAQLCKLPYGQNRLFQKLREMGVLISGGSRHNQPKQAYVEQGLFNVHEGSYIKDKELIPTFTTTVTQKGLAWIVKNLGKKEAA